MFCNEKNQDFPETGLSRRSNTMRNLIRDKPYAVMVYVTYSIDHLTPCVGATLIVTISKAGGSFASISPTVNDRGNGWYAINLVTADTDTEGDLALHATTAAANIDTVELVMQVEARPPCKTAVVVADAGNTTITFKTDLAETTADYWKDCYLTFLSGNLVGQTRRITAYNGATKFVTVDAFTNTPAGADKFTLINF